MLAQTLYRAPERLPSPPQTGPSGGALQSLYGNAALLDMMRSRSGGSGMSAQGYEPVDPARDELLFGDPDPDYGDPYFQYARNEGCQKVSFGYGGEAYDGLGEAKLARGDVQVGAWTDEDGDACVGAGASFTGIGVDVTTSDREGPDAWAGLGGAFCTYEGGTYFGSDGAQIGGVANLAECELSGGTGLSAERGWDTNVSAGACLGVGAGIDLAWDDKDGDGVREIGGQVDVACVPGLSFGFESEALGQAWNYVTGMVA